MPTPPPPLALLTSLAIGIASGCSKIEDDLDIPVVEGIAVSATATASLGPRFVDPVAVGDVDGDGFDDLAVFDSVGEPGTPRRAKILFGRAERLEGHFAADELVPLPVTVSDTAEARLLGLGDLDGDGDDELGVVSPGALQVHLGGPASSSAPPMLVACPPEGSSGFLDVANVGDMDGDGTTDLALSQQGRVWLLTGAELIGNAARDCRAGRLLLQEDEIIGSHTLVRVPGDLDGDGFADLVASRHGGVLIHFGGAVDQGPHVDALFEGGHWVGSPGIAPSGTAGPTLLLSDTSTSFVVGEPSTLRRLDGSTLDATAQSVTTTHSCAYRIAGDLDGDGAADIVGFDGGGCGTPGAVRVWYGGGAEPRPPDGTIVPEYAPTHVVAAGDLDGDGLDDLVLAGDDGKSARLDLIYGAPRD